MSTQECPRCGRPVAPDAPGGLCAACLLEAGAETYSAGSSSTDFMPTVSSAAAVGTAVGARRAPRLNEGDRWGSYHDIFALTIGVALLSCVAMWLAAPRRLRRDRTARPDKR